MKLNWNPFSRSIYIKKKKSVLSSMDRAISMSESKFVNGWNKAWLQFQIHFLSFLFKFGNFNLTAFFYEFQWRRWMDPYWGGWWRFNCSSTWNLSSFYIGYKGKKNCSYVSVCLIKHWKHSHFILIIWKCPCCFLPYFFRIILKQSDTLSVNQYGCHTIGQPMRWKSDKTIWSNYKKDFNANK